MLGAAQIETILAEVSAELERIGYITSRGIDAIIPWEQGVQLAQVSDLSEAITRVIENCRATGGEDEIAAEISLNSALGPTDVLIKRLIARAKKRGCVTYDSLNEALPQDQMTSEQIEDVMSTLSEMGVNIVESVEEYGEEDSTEAALWPSGKLRSNEVQPALLRLFYEHQSELAAQEAARNPLTPTTDLRLLVEISDKIDRLLANHLNADATVLRTLANSSDGAVLRSLLEHPAIDASVLSTLARSRYARGVVGGQVAAHPDASENVCTSLLAHYPHIVQQNPAFQRVIEAGPHALFAALSWSDRNSLLYDDQCPSVIRAWACQLAADPLTEPSLLKELARYGDKRSGLVAANPSVDYETARSLVSRHPGKLAANPGLAKLLREKLWQLPEDCEFPSQCFDLTLTMTVLNDPACLEDTIRWARSMAADPAAPKHVLMRLIGNFPELVADNPVFDWLLLEDPGLLSNLEEDVVRAMIRHERCPAKLIDWACSGQVKAAQLALLRRTDLTGDQLGRLARSTFPRVAENASAQLLRKGSSLPHHRSGN